MNLPNKLTLMRLVLVPVFMTFTVIDNAWTRLFALLIFITASLTDLYDGYLARKYSQETTFGTLMDPLADKFLISAAFVSFVSLRELDIPPWMVVFIIGREFLVTGLRLLAAAKGELIASDRTGKFKTMAQIIAILAILVILCVNSFLHRFFRIHPEDLLLRSGWVHSAGMFLERAPYWLVFISTVLTLLSGVSYLYKNRRIFEKEVGLTR